MSLKTLKSNEQLYQKKSVTSCHCRRLHWTWAFAEKRTTFLRAFAFAFAYNNCLRFDLWQQQSQQHYDNNNNTTTSAIFCLSSFCVHVKCVSAVKAGEKGEKLSRKNVWAQINDSSHLRNGLNREKKWKEKYCLFYPNVYFEVNIFGKWRCGKQFFWVMLTCTQ